MLSNTATPYYYGLFRDKVLNGEIPVCKEISMEMNRIDDLIDNPGVYYDDKAIDGFVAFCENEMTLTNGGPLKLLDTFKLWAEQALSWFYYEDRSVYVPNEDGHGGKYKQYRIKKRLTNKQYIITSRGSAKSLYASLMQAYGLNCDTMSTQQITTAPTLKQAEEVMTPIKTAIQVARGPLFKFLTEGSLQNTTGSRAKRAKLQPTKRGIENLLTNSILEMRPMSIDKLQGLKCKYATVDEWLSGETREDVIGAIEQGASKQNDYLIIAISSEGTVRNGVGDTIKMELNALLRGEYQDPHTSIFHYKLDDIEEVNDPDMWMKACPNIGLTVSYEVYQQEVERAERAPSTRNDIMAKRFGIPMEGLTYFFPYEDTLPFRHEEFWGLPCSMGCDLSRGDDFCSFVFLFPLADGSFGVKNRCYITSLTLNKLPAALASKYEEFINEGSLFIMEGTILDMVDVYDDLDNFITERGYEVMTVGYDPYNAKTFIERWAQENGNFGIEKVIQGSQTESVPLGEMKSLAGERMLKFDEAIFAFGMGNAVTLEDNNGNRKLLKQRKDKKIDPVAACMDALVAYKRNRDAFM